MITFIYQKYRKHPKVKDEKGLLPLVILADILAVMLLIECFTSFRFFGV